MKFYVWCFVAFAFANSVPVSKSDYILAIFPLDIATNQRFSRPILRELASRGHTVTVITPVEDLKPLPNYRQIIVPRIPLWDAVSTNDNSSIASPKKSSHREIQIDLRNRSQIIADTILSSKAMKNFMSEDKTPYNLIICELFNMEAFYIFSHIYKAPIVGFSSFGHAHFVNQIVGNPYELSYISHENLLLPKRFKILDRLQNAYWTMVDLIERGWWMNSEQEELVKKHFSHLKEPLPSLKDLEKNITLVLVNSHFTVDTVRPMVPGIIEVGGVHIDTPRKLPKEVDAFLAQATDGIIYVNFESDVFKSEICPARIKLFLKAFKRLKQRIVWAWEGEEIQDVPQNVMIIKPIPQSDILGYAKVELLITHGGQIHVQEAVSRGIPILCIPMYGDQFSTCSKAVQDGYGKELAVEDLSEETIMSATVEVSEGSRIQEKIEMASSLFNDKPNPAMYTAIYWIEYAARGANHIKSPALELSWYEYYLLDTVAIMWLAAYYIFRFISWMWMNVVLRKKVPRENIQHLIEKPKKHYKEH